MKIKVSIDLNVSRLVRSFVLVDLALFAGWGFVDPIFSIFVIQKVAGATLATVGVAAGIYLVVKSLLQLPIADYLDVHPGEGDDFMFLVSGLLLASFSALLYILVDKTWQLYFLQLIRALAFSLYTPSWSGIFSRHLDKDRVSFDWSLDSTTVGLAAGVSGFLGSLLAERFGFPATFIAASILSMVAVLILVAAPDFIFPHKTTSKPVIKDHSTPGMIK